MNIQDIFYILKSLMRIINLVVISVFLFFACLVFYFNFPKNGKTNQTFIIKNNESFQEVVKNLHKQGIIDNYNLFFYIYNITIPPKF